MLPPRRAALTLKVPLVAAGIALSLTASSLGMVELAHAQSSFNPVSAAELTTRIGLATTKLWLEDRGIDIPSSSLPLEEQHAKIEEALQRYETLRDDFAGVSKAGSAMEHGATGIGLGLSVWTKSPLPLLVGGGFAIGLGVGNDKLERIGKHQATRMLAVIADDLIDAAGVADFPSLVAQPHLLRDTVIASAPLLQDIKARAVASGDPAFITMAADILQRTAHEIDVATLDSVARLDGKVAEMEASFGDFIQTLHDSNRQIGDRLDQHEALINDLGSNLQKLGEDVTAVHDQVQHLGRNQDLLVDFMFSDLLPEQKVAALRSGLMDDRIRCPEDNGTECNPEELRATLIDRYKTEATVKEHIARAGEILQGINDIQTITANLGIDIGDEGRAIFRLASGAANAYMSILSGNLLGAIASITSIFSNRPDPDAERFRIMMTYLEDQFGVINKKLNALLENQEKIFEAVVAVSEQLQRSHEILDGRLRQIAWEQRQISTNLKELIWAEWRSCYSVYRYALAPNPAEAAAPLANPNTLGFESFADVRAVVDGRGDQIAQCLSTVQQSMDSISATNWFGSFLDARRAVEPDSFVDPATLASDRVTDEVAKEAHDLRTIEQRHREDIVIPASNVADGWAKRNEVARSTLLHLQMSRIANVRQLRSVTDEIGNGARFGCASAHSNNWALRELICLPTENPDTTAEDLMGFAIDADILLEIVNWMEVLSQITDLYRPSPPGFAASLDELATFPGPSLGEEITRKTVGMIGLAIAYYSRTYGGITALAIAEDILSGAADDTHRTVLRNNPYLAENTALLLLHLKRDTWNLMAGQVRPTFESNYTQALLHARSESDTWSDPLYALFGRNHSFAIDDDGKVGFSIAMSGGDAFLPLPPPTRLVEGKFIFPPRYLALIERQDRLIDRYFDYQLGKDKELAVVILQ